MTANKRLLQLATMSLSISVGLVSICHFPTRVQAQPSHWEISQAFDAPGGTAPSTSGGGARSDCIKSATPLTALIPGNSMPLTVNSNPRFFVYLPKTEAKTAEFVLKDENENDVYRQTMSLPSTPGIVSFQLPGTELGTNLEVGKKYHWYWALVCKPEDRREDVFVDSWIERINPSADVSFQLTKVSPEQRPGVYAKAGIWEGAITSLAELHRSHPEDPTITANWNEFLKSVNLDKFATEPLVN